MAFPEDQLSFCGATIREFRSQLGWSEQPSSLSITLVEDPKLSQEFISPTVGSPAYFEYNGWTFGGVFQSWTRTRGAGGFTYEVILNDPRAILEGARVILYGYSGITFNIPNIYNVFGYLESTLGFGGSGAAEQSGINAIVALNTLQGLINTTSITFNGYSYKIDLSNVIKMCDTNYNLQGSDMSILDIISTVARDGISDFFIRLEYRNFQNYIIPYFVSRKNPPYFGAIGNFINVTENTYGNVSNTVGRELITEPTSKMLTGGKVCKIYYTDQTQHSRYVTGLKDDGTYYQNNYKIALDERIVEPTDLLKWRDELVDSPRDKYIDWRDKIRRHAQQQAEEASIWPYWGHDARGDLVIGYGIPNSTYSRDNVMFNRDMSFSHKMIIDGREIAQIISSQNGGRIHPALVDYMTDVAELAFAQISFDEWLRYIIITSMTPLHHNRFYYLEPNNNFDCYDVNSDDGFNNHFRYQGYWTKLEALFGFSESFMKVMRELDTAICIWVKNNYAANLTTNIYNIADQFIVATNKLLDLNNNRRPPPGDVNANKALDVQEVYNVIKAFAEEHLGKKYMVRTPSIQAKRDPDTDSIIYSVHPTSGGFFEESVWPVAIAQALMPGDVNKVLDSDGRIKSYVRFNNAIVESNGFKFGRLNPTKIGLDNIATNKNIDNENNPYDDYFFVPCSVEENPVFLDNATLDSPRMVVVLPQPMLLRLEKGYNHLHYLLYNVLMHYKYFIYNDFTYFGPGGIDLRPIYVNNAKNMISDRVGNDGYVNSILGAPTVMPDVAFIALESNVERYGPWYVAGISGPSEFEIADELVPWNYGGFTELNIAANARLYQAGANRLEMERGTVEFPGAPTYLLGDAMVANGPVITSINVQIDPQAGVTTTYNMQSWTPQFGQVPKQFTDRLNLINKIKYNQFKLANDIDRLRQISTSNINFKMGTSTTPTSASRKDATHSSMVLLGASHIKRPEMTLASAAAMPGYYLENQAGENYEDKAFMAMEGMFRAYTTETQVDTSGMPHFESPVSGAEEPTVVDLNPFGGNHDVSLVSRNLNLETTSIDNVFANPYLYRHRDQEPSPTSIKAVSLKGPLIVTGWGYDTNGKPVPSGGDGVSFIENHRCREDLWKTGPVDLRWDNSRKVWSAGAANSVYIGHTRENIYAGSSGLVNILDPSGGSISTSWGSTNTVYAHEILLPHKTNFQIYANTIVILTKINGSYFIINAGNNTCTG